MSLDANTLNRIEEVLHERRVELMEKKGNPEKLKEVTELYYLVLVAQRVPA